MGSMLAILVMAGIGYLMFLLLKHFVDKKTAKNLIISFFAPPPPLPPPFARRAPFGRPRELPPAGAPRHFFKSPGRLLRTYSETTAKLAGGVEGNVQTKKYKGI